MTNYSLSAYGTNPNAGVYVNQTRERGWGAGWPTCQTDRQVWVESVVSVKVRREIAPLVDALMRATVQRGYALRNGSVLGYACRPIGGTNRPSNHSWGLAIDIHPSENPNSYTFRCNIPPAIVRMWELCGFYWGGRYRSKYDTMHFEYIRRPSDVAADLTRARTYLAQPTVSLAKLIQQNAALTKTYTPDVLTTQKALAKEVGLDYSSGPGIFGPATRAAYVRWQEALGFSGDDADGIPGRISLTKLGDRNGFKVV